MLDGLLALPVALYVLVVAQMGSPILVGLIVIVGLLVIVFAPESVAAFCAILYWLPAAIMIAFYGGAPYGWPLAVLGTLSLASAVFRGIWTRRQKLVNPDSLQ